MVVLFPCKERKDDVRAQRGHGSFVGEEGGEEEATNEIRVGVLGVPL